MLNGQLSDMGYESHLTQVASYFDIVDAAVKTGDTNKRYSISTNVSTAPSPPHCPPHTCPSRRCPETHPAMLPSS